MAQYYNEAFDSYADVPVELVEKFIDSHGGIEIE